MPVEDGNGAGVNPSPFQPPKATPVPAPESKADVERHQMTVWARWAIENHVQFTYTEGADRWHMVESKPGTLPQSADCSAFVTGLAKWAGASDPNGLNFTGGYTGTLLSHCDHISVNLVRMGDLICYGPNTGSHVVYVMERIGRKNDFYCASHGEPGDPERITHSALLAYFGSDSARFLRWLS